VVQFLSYEGTMTAAGGPAAGLTSTDIGVFQDQAPLGTSLQLTGTGSSYGDFTWAFNIAATSGGANTGRASCRAPIAARSGSATRPWWKAMAAPPP
jgi:hypothetical protein